MKISKVEVMALEKDMGCGGSRPIIVRIYTDEGLWGTGEAGVAIGSGSRGAFEVLKDFAPMIKGMDPMAHEAACIEIPMGRGVCGTAAKEDRTLVVPDVHCFRGHIACDSASRSEIVIPLHKDGRVIGVLDIDSPEPDRFSEEDRTELERFAAILEQTAIEY